MKLWWLPLTLGICLCACEENKARRTEQHSTSQGASKEIISPSNSGGAVAEQTFWKPTGEQLGSTLRVQVAFGVLPPRDYTGALVHHDDVPNKAAVQGKARFVLAMLKGWTERQLNDPSGQITVIRNRTNRQGSAVASNHPARLLQFNQQNGIAVLAYLDEFDYDLDVGFRLVRSTKAEGSVNILRTSEAPGSGTRTGQNSKSQVSKSPFPVEAGLYLPGTANQGRVQLPKSGGEANSDAMHLAVGEPDKLLGFVDAGQGGTATLTSLGSFEFQPRTNIVKPLGIAFGELQGSAIKFGISTKSSPEDMKTGTVSLRVLKSPTPPQLQIDRTVETEAFAPIEAKTILPLRKNRTNEDQWSEYLQAPTEVGEEFAYLLQLSWPLFPQNFSPQQSSPLAYGQPFLVKLQRKADGVHHTVEGLPDLNAAAEKAANPGTKFPLEAPAYDIHEIGGGREVLMRFDGPPFWKRFSLSRNEWLPMPPVNLSDVSVTGNLNALFVLDRGAAEIRKYSLTDLRPLGVVKLPTDSQYTSILTGCNSERSPVYVMTQKEVRIFAPDTLQRRDAPAARLPLGRYGQEFKFSKRDRFHIAGDGKAFSVSPNGDDSSAYHLACADDTLGVSNKFSNMENFAVGKYGVSGAYTLRDDGWLISIATPGGERLFTKEPPPNRGRPLRWLLPSSPIILRLAPANSDALPPQPARLECFSYFDTLPFAEVRVPELSDRNSQISNVEMERMRWMSFDPYSARLGFLARDRNVWITHQLKADENRKQPVLLNWPDTSLPRGREFRFKPLFFSGNNFSAELRGLKEPTTPLIAAGNISFPINQKEVASFLLMTLKVPGAEGSELSYPMPLYVAGTQFPLVAPVNTAPGNLNSFATGFKSLSASKQGQEVLPTTVHVFNDRIRQILGPVAGHLVLVTASQRIDFFSLEARKVVRSIPSAAKASYYTGAEGLYEYNLATRTFARISVPLGQRERSLALPNGLRLHALAVGSQPNSPLTLLLEKIKNQSTEQFGNWVLTTTDADHDVVVLDSRTLQAAGWAQPKFRSGKKALPFISPYSIEGLTEFPKHCPSGHSGQFITLRHAFIALGQRLSITAPFPDAQSDLHMSAFGSRTPTGSISGMRVADSFGDVFTGGINDNFRRANQDALSVTPCGRYRLFRVNREIVEVRTVENNTPLFRVGRLSLFHEDFYTVSLGPEEGISAQVRVLSDNGPLAILAAGGRSLQLVDFDIPRLAAEINPEEFHVISQASPCMMEGTTLDYQIQVNNPNAVSTYRLRDEAEGVSLSPTGLLRYTAPRQVAEPTRVTFSTELVGKNGKTVLHEFPIIVLPFPRSEAPPKPEPTRRPSI